MAHAKKFKSADEAITTVMDNPEGAGLGIIITMLMLSRIGLHDNNYTVDSDDTKTFTKLRIPISFVSTRHKEIINDVIRQEINDIPQFPAHIIEIQKLLSDPDVDIRQLSLKISSDPSLTANIIKYSNSPVYHGYSNISNITDAVKVIGLKGIRNIVYSFGSEKILKERYDPKTLQSIFDHSQKVAEVTFKIARKKVSRRQLEDLFVAAMLHDLGRIITIGIDTEGFIVKMNNICHKHGIPLKVVEEMSSGYNHPIIGSLLAEKWNFPDLITNVIRYNDKPSDGPSKYKEILYSVYLGNYIATRIENDEIISFADIDEHVKEFFEIKEEKDLETIVESLNDEDK